jgi:hypothetical protein
MTELVVQPRLDGFGHRIASVVGQSTGRWLAREPYWPHCGHARCGRCLAPQAGFWQITRDGAAAFHWERR